MTFFGALVRTGRATRTEPRWRRLGRVCCRPIGTFDWDTLRLNQGMGLFDALFAHAILELAEDANVCVVLER